MLPQCLELHFKNGIFLERTSWSFLEMSHVKQDHQWAVGSGLPGVSLGKGSGGGWDRVGKRTKTKRGKAGRDQGANIPVLETGSRLRNCSNGSGIMVGRKGGRGALTPTAGLWERPPGDCWWQCSVIIHHRNGPVPRPAISLLPGLAWVGGREIQQALTRAL